MFTEFVAAHMTAVYCEQYAVIVKTFRFAPFFASWSTSEWAIAAASNSVLQVYSRKHAFVVYSGCQIPKFAQSYRIRLTAGTRLSGGRFERNT